MLNYTRIPAPRVTIVDPQTGIVSNEWFRFFNNLYTIAYAATGSVTPGTYGSATAVPQITVDDFGTITGISNVPIAIDASQIVSGTIASARISGAYTGITGVGTLTVGTWNATAITTPYGGTGLTSYTAGDTLYYASGTALTKLAIGASTYINTSSGTAPQWTDPATITVGKATNLVGGAANRIAYQTAADTTGFIVAPTVSDTYLNWSGTAFQWSSNPLGTVTSVSVVSANGLAGTVATATTTPAITLTTTVTGLLKGNGTAISAASSGTDYAPATSGTSILYGNGAGGFSNVTIGTGVSFAAGTLSATGSGGTVTSVAALTLGTTGTDLSSTVANGTTTPVITLQVPTASSVNRGALSAADWTTFNSKAPGVTFTTNYIPYGQGTTTLNQSAGLQFNGTNFTTTGFATATSFRPSASTVPTNGMYLPAANSVGFATNSTNAIYIDSSQNIGIGTATPGGTLDINSTYGTSPTNGSNAVKIYSSTTAAVGVGPSIFFGGQTGNSTAKYGFAGIQGFKSSAVANNYSGALAFFTQSSGGATALTEQMRIHSSGGVSIGNTTDPGATNLSVTGTGQFGTTVGVGAATPSASGAGITFPATQSASTNANTLDDYEEGTFTPTIIGTTTAGTGTYSANSQIGRYTKIGNRVYFTVYLQWSAHTGTGNMRVAGLPFTSIATAGTFNALSTWYQNITMTASNLLAAYVNVNATTVELAQTPVGGGAATAIPIDTAASLMLTGHYETT